MRFIESTKPCLLRSRTVVRAFAFSLCMLLVGQLIPSLPEMGVDLKEWAKSVYAKAYYTIFVPKTYFIRNGGGSTVQCTGLANVDYDGSGSAEACAFSNPQDGYNAATFGDTIKLTAGQTFATVDDPFSEWALPDKGTAPTNTDSDYITITTTDTSGTPAALSGYPAARTRITDALAANMPHVVGNGSTPLFRMKSGAEYWRIERLDWTNDGTNGYQTVVFFDTDPINSLAAVPHHFQIRYNWIHPDEETGTALTSSNDDRSAENAIYFTGKDVLIENNAIQGFVGRVRYGDPGAAITSAGILIASYAEDVIIRNNLLEAWTYAFFVGGSGMPDWAVTEGATVVSCSDQTHCTLTNVTGLAVGDPISLHMSSATWAFDSTGNNIIPGGPTWGASFVAAIDTINKIVTFTDYICHSYDGGNRCQAIPSGDPDVPANRPTPVNGDKVRWNGLQPTNITITRNIFAHNPEWAPLMDGNCGGKGYLEIKACVNCLLEGNILTGCTGPTITVRNQDGDFCWVTLDGLNFRANLWEGSDRVFTSYFRDSTPTAKSQNVMWEHNLITGLNVTFGAPGGEFSSSTNGAINFTIRHNTVAWSKTNSPGATQSAWHNISSSLTVGAGYSGTLVNFVVENNILPVGQNACFVGEGSTVLSTCWPNAVIRNNVFLNVDGHADSDVTDWWREPIGATNLASNSFITSYNTVQFVSPNSTLSFVVNSGLSYRLATGSPYHNGATDGTDIGYNHTILSTALGFNPETGGTPPPSFTTCKWSTSPPCVTP